MDIVISTASSTFSRQEGDSIQTVDHEGQSSLVDEATAAGVKQFIFVSFAFRSHSFPLQTAKQQAEEKIKASGMSYCIIKPSFFMQTWLSPAVGFDYPQAKATIYGEGKNKISWIAITDVAAFTVSTVDNPHVKNRSIEIGGPEALSPLEAISIFEEVGGKKFELQHVPVDALKTQMKAAPDDLGKTFAGLMLFYASGHEVNMQETLKVIPLELTSVQEYAAKMSA